MEHLQYPIGRFSVKAEYTDKEIEGLIQVMESSPTRYKQLLQGATEEQLSLTYRPSSWTVRQLLHHVADIHLLNFLRVKKTLTEENYTATVIDMNAWAATSDASTAPIEGSLLMLDGINRRFMYLLESVDEQAFAKGFYHPVRQMHFTLKGAIHMAVWHMEHHQAHIELALSLQPHRFSFT